MDNVRSATIARVARRGAAAQKGMTLVEIMVVIAIIGLVMGAVVVAAVPQLESARCKTAWSETQTIQQAIATFQTDNAGDCPKSLDDLVSQKFLSKSPVDPWGQAFKYKCPGDKMTDGADIWSSGKNKQEGDEDDVRGWLKLEEACKRK
jgi:general secretion pathway protein G